jgi:hypothetical protein
MKSDTDSKKEPVWRYDTGWELVPNPFLQTHNQDVLSALEDVVRHDPENQEAVNLLNDLQQKKSTLELEEVKVAQLKKSARISYDKIIRLNAQIDQISKSKLLLDEEVVDLTDRVAKGPESQETADKIIQQATELLLKGKKFKQTKMAGDISQLEKSLDTEFENYQTEQSSYEGAWFACAKATADLGKPLDRAHELIGADEYFKTVEFERTQPFEALDENAADEVPEDLPVETETETWEISEASEEEPIKKDNNGALQLAETVDFKEESDKLGPYIEQTELFEETEDVVALFSKDEQLTEKKRQEDLKDVDVETEVVETPTKMPKSEALQKLEEIAKKRGYGKKAKEEKAVEDEFPEMTVIPEETPTRRGRRRKAKNPT